MKLNYVERVLIKVLVISILYSNSGFGHDLSRDGNIHAHSEIADRPTQVTSGKGWTLAQLVPGPKTEGRTATPSTDSRPAQASVFEAFAPRVKIRWDEKFLFVENNGIPAHNMMVGITAWQQQVPIPQNYVGANAWQIPRVPVPAKNPVSIRSRFLRGAVALAANGIPIFNPQNNRGEVSAEIGELDQWGGHCGRADDYHYHAAPLHLESVVGKGNPIAYALDGYPIYGLVEPNGAEPSGLDAFNGHKTPQLGYHYHASKKYPYINGGFYGEVVEKEGQVDPQPRAQAIRPDTGPLRGAKITGFTMSQDAKAYALQYSVDGKQGAVNYARSDDGSWKFQFVSVDGATRDETFRAGDRSGGGGRGGRDKKERGLQDGPPVRPASSAKMLAQETRELVPAPLAQPRPVGAFVLKSPVVQDGGALPVEFTGDGSGITPPLEWSGAPEGVKSYALIMHHVDPEGKTKWYWTQYKIPGNIDQLPQDVRGIGVFGNNSVNDRAGYAPPHSKGPGAKTYTITLYALSEEPKLTAPPASVSREVLLAAIKDITLSSAELRVVYTRPGTEGAAPSDRKPSGNGPEPRPPRDPNRPQTGGGGARPPRPDEGGAPPPRP